MAWYPLEVRKISEGEKDAPYSTRHKDRVRFSQDNRPVFSKACQNMKLVNSRDAGLRRHATPITLGVFTPLKRAFATRNVPEEAMRTLITGDIAPVPGDLVIARVDRLRQHLRLELPNGRSARLFTGDHILVCYGNRYAPDQYESLVPERLTPCHLVAAGGIASQMRCRNPKVKNPTEITPLGLVGNGSGIPLNLRDWKADSGARNQRNAPLFVVVGSSMNAGKTTTAARLVRGLAQDGFRTGAMKVTGTGSGGDLWHLEDAGASLTLDFTDAGHASTYGLGDEAVLEIVNHLGNALRNRNVDVIVAEVADGLLQAETRALLTNPGFRKQVSGVFHAAVDAHSAIYGVDFLQRLGYAVCGVSGVVSSSQLARKEYQENCPVPMITKSELCAPGFGFDLMSKNFGRAADQVARG